MLLSEDCFTWNISNKEYDGEHEAGAGLHNEAESWIKNRRQSAEKNGSMGRPNRCWVQVLEKSGAIQAWK